MQLSGRELCQGEWRKGQFLPPGYEGRKLGRGSGQNLRRACRPVQEDGGAIPEKGQGRHAQQEIEKLFLKCQEKLQSLLTEGYKAACEAVDFSQQADLNALTLLHGLQSEVHFQ